MNNKLLPFLFMLLNTQLSYALPPITGCPSGTVYSAVMDSCVPDPNATPQCPISTTYVQGQGCVSTTHGTTTPGTTTPGTTTPGTTTPGDKYALNSVFSSISQTLNLSSSGILAVVSTITGLMLLLAIFKKS